MVLCAQNRPPEVSRKKYSEKMIKNHDNCLQQFGQTAKQYKKIKKNENVTVHNECKGPNT